jgi:hypothetical protein
MQLIFATPLDLCSRTDQFITGYLVQQLIGPPIKLWRTRGIG